MAEERALVTVASWEDRFRLGTERLLSVERPTTVLMFHYREYAEWSRFNRARIRSLCKEYAVKIQEVEVSFEPIEAWRSYSAALDSYRDTTTDVMLDFTTAPRESIWTLLYILTKAGVRVSYVYHTPESYNSEWLSRDPGEPRLMLKMSGLQDLTKPTILLILTGFDLDRTTQLVTFYEPMKTLLGMQTGSQFSNQELNVFRHDKILMGEANVESFEVDLYGVDHGFREIEEKVAIFLGEANIVVSSLGPKPSAVALFKIWSKYPEIALAYAPSNEYNRYYSQGLGERIVLGRL